MVENVDAPSTPTVIARACVFNRPEAIFKFNGMELKIASLDDGLAMTVGSGTRSQ